MSRCRERVLVQVILVLGVAASASELAAPQKAPIPDAQALAAAQKAAGELFGVRFRSAKTAADKSAVAAEMIEAALKLQDGTADQYVLLKIAREIASGAGEAATALQAAEKQAERFDVSAAKLKAETLLAAARQAKATAQHKAVAEAALQLVGDWTDASEIELPLSVCEAGRSAAQKSRQFELVKELAAKADDLKKQRKAAQEYRRGAGRHGQGPRRTGREPDGRAIPVLRRRRLGARRSLSGPGQRRGLEGRGAQGTARGCFRRRASCDRRHVVGLSGDQTGSRAGQPAASGRFVVSAGRTKPRWRSDRSEGQTAAAGDRQARPRNPCRPADFRPSTATVGEQGLQNGDFRNRLEGWTVEGSQTAFFVFALGDNMAVTSWGVRKDAETGRLSQTFTVPRNARTLRFFVHGGNDPASLYVALGRGNDLDRPCHGQERQYTIRSPLGHHFGPRRGRDTGSCGPESGPLGIHHGSWISD